MCGGLETVSRARQEFESSQTWRKDPSAPQGGGLDVSLPCCPLPPPSRGGRALGQQGQARQSLPAELTWDLDSFHSYR